ncbi:HD domain-containing protein [Salsuginibacillus kocurii]|uniref:HD domain-containing protein n=1 Tax=Salsuginibacillus kocurii TaxID=427078 RepID=UPI00036946BD|nr:HD domain-containing protein [Salsuginibacillus kocurii]
MEKRLQHLFHFLKVIDRFKTVERQTINSIDGRHENDAEHTWHMCMYAFILRDEVEEELDMERVFYLILTHDLVEILAGDTLAYNEEAKKGQKEREEKAAKELFANLPADLEAEFHACFEEFEKNETPEAQFVKALDRMQAYAQNVFSGGWVWKHHQVAKEDIRARSAAWNENNQAFQTIFQMLWNEAEEKSLFYNDEKKST